MESNSKAVCKYCRSNNTRKYGKYRETQLYYCGDCERKFTPNDSLFHMKTPSNQVSAALDMYYKGMSLNEIREHLQQEYENTPSSSTVFKWVTKYTTEAVAQCARQRPAVGDTWIADETFVRIDRHSRATAENPYSKSKKAKWIVFWDIIDADTRFLLASHITMTRGTQDAKALMEKAARVAGKAPKMVVTDKLAAYLDGTELAYGGAARHNQGGPFDVEKNTNLIERLHGTIKERTKVMRGLRTAETAKRFLGGWSTYYNFMKPHESLNSKTPAEAAGCDYHFRDWADVTRMTKPQVRVLVTPAKVEILPIVPIVKYRVPTRKLRVKKKKAASVETTLGRVNL